VARQHDDLRRLARIIKRDVPVRVRVLVRADRAAKSDEIASFSASWTRASVSGPSLM